MAITEAGRRHMDELAARHDLALLANRQIDTRSRIAAGLDTLAVSVETTWKTGDLSRFGVVLDHNHEDRMVRLIEVIPDVDPCPVCGRPPRKMRVNLLTVPEEDVTAVTDLSPAARIGWANKLLRAAMDDNSIGTDRGRRLVGWAVTIARGDNQ